MESADYSNPYSGQTFFGFILQLLIRFWTFIRGDISVHQLTSDEIQIIVLVGVSTSSALVGTFLILRKMTMLANSLSHTILVGIVIAFLFTSQLSDSLMRSDHFDPFNLNVMLLASLIMGIITAFLTEILIKGARLQEDASTGLVFTSLFAGGILALTTLTRNAHIGTEVVMGNVDILLLEDCKLVYLVLAINLLIFISFFKEFTITTFDSSLSKALGINPNLYNYLLMFQVSLTAICAFRAVGVLMVLAFITGPSLAARLLAKNLKQVLFLAVIIGWIASILGVAFSRHLITVYGVALSTGGLVVCMIVCIFILAAILNKRNSILALVKA